MSRERAKLYAAARRLTKNEDFLLVMGHLTSDQASVVLAMDTTNTGLQLAHSYYKALDDVTMLVNNLAATEGLDDGN